MEVTRSLLNPYLGRLRNEYEKLEQELRLHSSEEAAEFRSLIQPKLASLQTLLNGEVLQIQPQATFRRLKLELRFAKRKWQRFLCNEARVRRIEEKRNHVSPFAA